MPQPRVCIIIVNWNNYPDTAECLDSLGKVGYPDFEVLVVDNGSDGDDAERLRREYGDRVRVIANERNAGFAEGCNIGMRDALHRGADYLLLINNDTFVAPDFVDRLVEYVADEPGIGVAGGKVYCHEIPDMIWFAGGAIDFRTATTPIIGSGETDNGGYDEAREVEWICGCFMLISRHVVERVGLLDPRFFFGWEDVDLCVRARRAGFRIVFVPASRIWHKTLPPEKQKRLSGMPVYHATRGHFLFMQKHLSRRQRVTAAAYFVVRFPRFVWDYSKVMGEWKVPLYVVRAVAGHAACRLRLTPRRE